MAEIANLQIDQVSKTYGNILTSLRMLRGLAGAAASNLALLPIAFLVLSVGPAVPLSSAFLLLVGIAILDLSVLGVSFGLLRKIWSGSVPAARKASYFLLALSVIPMGLFIDGLHEVYERPPLVALELAGASVFLVILVLATRGLRSIIKAKDLPHSSLLFPPGAVNGVRNDVYRVLGVPVTKHQGSALPKRAFWFAAAAFIFEGAVFYTYLSAGWSLHKAAVRFRSFEVSVEHATTVGSGVVVLTVGTILLVGFLSTQWFLSLARRLRVRSRRQLLLSYERARLSDPRPPVLFLRPFSDDQISLKGAPLPHYMRLFDPGVEAATLDELIVQDFSSMGPVVALGKPSDQLPPIGAARKYVAEGEWQDVALSLVDQSTRIIVAVSDATNVLWEVDAIVERGHLSKSVFVFPPARLFDRKLFLEVLSRIHREKGSVRRWSTTSRRRNVWAKPDAEMGIIAFVCDGSGSSLTVLTEGATELDYAIGIRAAVSRTSVGALVQ